MSTSSDCPLRAWLTFRGGRREDVHIDNLSDNGAALRLPRERGPNLSCGERVSIGFLTTDGGEAKIVPAVLRFCGTDGPHRLYGIWFQSQSGDPHGLPSGSRVFGGPTLRRLFNRRQTLRTTLHDADLPSTVAWGRTPDASGEATVLDLSARGIGLLVPSVAALGLEVGHAVWVRLPALVSTAGELPVAVVRYIGSAGDRTRIGLEIVDAQARPVVQPVPNDPWLVA